MPLPIMTDAQDIDAIIVYLKTKALGATIAEAKAAVEAKLLDPRKINAYRVWGFITGENDRLKLTERGRDFARATPDKKRLVFATIIREQKAYNLAIEHMFYKGFDELSASDVAAHWHQHCREEVGSDNETSINNQVTCFFGIAEAAGIGEYRIGRRGQPTRFTIDRDAIGQFIAETNLGATEDSAKLQPQADASDDDQEYAAILERSNVSKAQVVATSENTELPTVQESLVISPPETINVFISHSKNMTIVDQIKTMLDVAGLEYELAVEGESTAIPVPEKVLSAMRRCNAAIICVTADEQSKDNGNYSVNANVLIEIGAAFVLYDRKVVLVWDRRLSVPSNLQGLYRCEFEGTELSWTSGMKLLKAIGEFKSRIS